VYLFHLGGDSFLPRTGNAPARETTGFLSMSTDKVLLPGYPLQDGLTLGLTLDGCRLLRSNATPTSRFLRNSFRRLISAHGGVSLIFPFLFSLSQQNTYASDRLYSSFDCVEESQHRNRTRNQCTEPLALEHSALRRLAM